MGIINAAPLSMGLFTPMGASRWHRARLNESVMNAVSNAFEYTQVKLSNYNERMSFDIYNFFSKANNVDLTKLAFLFSVNQPDADVTLFSVTSKTILEENIKHLKDGMNDKEKKVLNDVYEV